MGCVLTNIKIALSDNAANVAGWLKKREKEGQVPGRVPVSKIQVNSFPKPGWNFEKLC